MREWVQEKHSRPTNVAVFEKRSVSPIVQQCLGHQQTLDPNKCWKKLRDSVDEKISIVGVCNSCNRPVIFCEHELIFGTPEQTSRPSYQSFNLIAAVSSYFQNTNRNASLTLFSKKMIFFNDAQTKNDLKRWSMSCSLMPSQWLTIYQTFM